MPTPRRHFLQIAASAATLTTLSRTALALEYPTRPIHWIIGFPAGGGADIVAGIMGGWLSERLGQQIIIENRPGAGTNIAASPLHWDWTAISSDVTCRTTGQQQRESAPKFYR